MRSEQHEQHHEPSRFGPAHRAAGSGTRRRRTSQRPGGDGPSVCGCGRRYSTETGAGGSGDDGDEGRQATSPGGGLRARGAVVSGGVRPTRRRHGDIGRRARSVGARVAPANGAAEASGTSAQRRATAPDAVLPEKRGELVREAAAIRRWQRGSRTAREMRCRRARPGSSSSGK